MLLHFETNFSYFIVYIEKCNYTREIHLQNPSIVIPISKNIHLPFRKSIFPSSLYSIVHRIKMTK